MEECTMYDRPPDIAELERMLNGAESDAVLNEKAIEIFERLKNLKTIRKYFGHIKTDDLDLEAQDLGRVLGTIRSRRRDGVLDEYDNHVAKNG